MDYHDTGHGVNHDVYLEGHYVREGKWLDTVDVEGRTGGRMVLFSRPTVWVDTTRSYRPQIPPHLWLMTQSFWTKTRNFLGLL